LIPFLVKEKFELMQFNLPPFSVLYPPSDTLFLDLNPSLEDIFKQIEITRRRGIKKGLESPFKVRLGGRDDLKFFYDLFNFSCRKHKYTDPVTQKKVDMYTFIEYDELYKMWDELAPYGLINLFLGTVEDEVICATLNFPVGNIFRAGYWGWNLKYAEYHISEANPMGNDTMGKNKWISIF